MFPVAERWRSTFMDHWPDELWDMSVPTEIVEPERDEALAFGSADPAFREAHELDGRLPPPPDLAERLDPVIASLGAVSPRLSACSFKGSASAGLPVRSGEQMVRLAMQRNHRVATFLADALERGEGINLYLREWRHVARDAEFRAFIRNDRTVAVSQYFAREAFNWSARDLVDLTRSIRSFVAEFASRASFEEVVVDFAIDAGGTPFLIETNPFVARTDTALFAFAKRPMEGQLLLHDTEHTLIELTPLGEIVSRSPIRGGN